VRDGDAPGRASMCGTAAEPCNDEVAARSSNGHGYGGGESRAAPALSSARLLNERFRAERRIQWADGYALGL
jgi:hypothetical protein